jgi:RimJ/RimL family protein N-acetyltransferase
MRKVIGNQDEYVAQWVAKRIPVFEFGSTPYSAIGLMNEAGVMLAGVIYQNFTHRDIQVHIAAVEGKRWMSKHWLGEVFRYPFEQLGVHRITALIPESNSVSESFTKRMGFSFEGSIREILAGDEDLLIYGMLRSECRFLGIGRFNGRISRFPTKSLSTAAPAL